MHHAQVLSAYRELVRQRRRFFDELCRNFIKQYTYEKFLSYSQARPEKVSILLDLAQLELRALKNANAGHSKETVAILDRCFGQYKTKEMPLKPVLGPRLDHGSLVYRVNNLSVPSARTMADHIANSKAARVSESADSLYYNYVDALKRAGVVTGRNDRKITYEPRIEGNVLGTELPANRLKNALKRSYSTVMSIMLLPVHKDILSYLEAKVDDPTVPRQHRNKYKRCLRDYFTVDLVDGLVTVVFSPKRVVMSKSLV